MHKYADMLCKIGGQCIGVAVSDSPTGGFTDIGRPLVNASDYGLTTSKEGWYTIDPTAWVDTDEDGTEHIYLNWGNTYNITCELEINGDNVSVKDIDGDGEITASDFVDSEFIDPASDSKIAYTEAPWLYRRQDENGKHYMFFLKPLGANATFYARQ